MLYNYLLIVDIYSYNHIIFNLIYYIIICLIYNMLYVYKYIISIIYNIVLYYCHDPIPMT